MKKVLYLLATSLLFGCARLEDIKPIEKYFGKDFIMVSKNGFFRDDYCKMTIKNKDTILRIYVLDVDRFNVKDTLK